jgi:hypothetical protein
MLRACFCERSDVDSAAVLPLPVSYPSPKVIYLVLAIASESHINASGNRPVSLAFERYVRYFSRRLPIPSGFPAIHHHFTTHERVRNCSSFVKIMNPWYLILKVLNSLHHAVRKLHSPGHPFPFTPAHTLETIDQTSHHAHHMLTPFNGSARERGCCASSRSSSCRQWCCCTCVHDQDHGSSCRWR